MQALSTPRPSEPYNPEPLFWTEGKAAEMLCKAIGDALSQGECAALARSLMLIFDGVALRRNLSIINIGSELVDTVTRLIVAQAGNVGEIRQTQPARRHMPRAEDGLTSPTDDRVMARKAPQARLKVR